MKKKSLQTAIEQDTMKSVPKIYKARARKLLDKIKGELLYENKPICGSHVLNETLRHQKGFEPGG